MIPDVPKAAYGARLLSCLCARIMKNMATSVQVIESLVAHRPTLPNPPPVDNIPIPDPARKRKYAGAGRIGNGDGPRARPIE